MNYEREMSSTGLMNPEHETTPPSLRAAASLRPATRLIAPMPGVIVMCEKNVGDPVQSGDVVLVLEAMKMENLITAPFAGKVLSLLVKDGEKVEKGTLLGTIG
jgi:biotin carboxyl carrier protein